MILALRQPLWLPISEFPEGAAEKEIEDDKKDENEDDSIHSGWTTVQPQSYGTVVILSTMLPADKFLKTNGLIKPVIAQTA